MRGPLPGPAMSPAGNEKDKEEHVFMMKDKRYALHGEMMMVVLVSIFSLFIFFIAVLPCIKTASNNSNTTSSQYESPGYCSRLTKLWRRSSSADEDAAPHAVSHHPHKDDEDGIDEQDEISQKFPF